jgi:hypothetical protein
MAELPALYLNLLEMQSAPSAITVARNTRLPATSVVVRSRVRGLADDRQFAHLAYASS